MRWVMEMTRASIQDFSNLVGITSREQDESVAESMRLCISSGEAGSKLDNMGGFDVFVGTEVSVLITLDGMEEHSLVILSLK